MAQSTNTGATNLIGLFEKTKTFMTQKVTEHPRLAFSITAILGALAIGCSLYRGGKYLWNKVQEVSKENGRQKTYQAFHSPEDDLLLYNNDEEEYN